MPMHFQYLDPTTREATVLNEVDRVMCEEQGITFSEKTYCNLFQILQWTATIPAVCKPDGTVDRDLFTRYLQGADWEPNNIHWAVRFTCERFIFTSWR